MVSLAPCRCLEVDLVLVLEPVQVSPGMLEPVQVSPGMLVLASLEVCQAWAACPR